MRRLGKYEKRAKIYAAYHSAVGWEEIKLKAAIAGLKT